MPTRDTVTMRPTDCARLNEPYPIDTDPPEAAARTALGMDLPHGTTLEAEILGDFTEQPPYGIGWWAPVRARAAESSSPTNSIAA